tara:strand:- start:13025 stop:14299 length:1275 start_codon:yes stop_codon:yes gene_type:complete
MKNFFDKFFLRSNNLDLISDSIKNLTVKTPAHKIFNAINSYNKDSEIRYVGGCIRKIINNEKIDDIDLATNLEPDEVCKVLEKNNINYIETGLEHGTVTVILDEYKFEITSLREDILTDGRHAKVKFSKSWKDDASRRDFTINSIYSDESGNLFDPYNGKKDLENGLIKFIGEPQKRISEDYLRILRYLRFFIKYSKKPHDLEIIKTLKINIVGISKLSKERLLDELIKIIDFDSLEKISKNKISLDLFLTIFPELKNLKSVSKIHLNKKDIVWKKDSIFLLSLLIIDETDNADYFLYKYNLSKKNKKRIKLIDNFYKNKKRSKLISDKDINKVFYFHGRQAVIDILNFEMLRSKKTDKKIIETIKNFENRSIPIMPIGADVLMTKYKIPEGKQLGVKLKMIEDEWIKNDFKISDQEVDSILKN